MARIVIHVITALWLISLSGPALAGGPTPAPRLTLKRVASEPEGGRKALSESEIAALKSEVQEKPRERARRFELVQGLIASGRLEEALSEARAWRRHDAYNLVVAKCSRIEIHTLDEQGLHAAFDMPIFGRIATMAFIGERNIFQSGGKSNRRAYVRVFGLHL